MKIPRLRLVLSAICFALVVGVHAAAPTTSYVFAYFTKNGEDGLHLAWSADGYKWEALNGGHSFLAPKVGKSKLMRDPCVVRGPDGTFHMVWTSGWTENDIGYASSKDLVTWSEEKELPVMAYAPTVRNTWAPEVHYDEKRNEFIIFWASTIPGKFPETAGASEDDYNHRIYCTTTKDFVAFTPTRLFYDPGFSVIDATMLHADGRHYLIVKDETRNPPKKNLRIAESDDVEGPFTNLSAPFSPAGLWVEGPTAIKVGDDFIVYCEAYMKKHYVALRSHDLKTWEDVTDQMTFVNAGTPERMKHGTVIVVPTELVAQLRAIPVAP
jgi:beta-xylosidase